MGEDVAGSVWSVADATELYDLPGWGRGYFTVGENGHLQVRPQRDSGHAIDVKDLIDQLQVRGLALPVLLRFNGVLRDRIRRLHEVFSRAIEDNSYTGGYRCVYPIKVNQQQSVVQKIVEYGAEFGFGLEAGSKPELLAVVAMASPETLVICNGFKDDEFIEMAMWAQKLGRKVIPVVEKYTELELILKHANRLGIRPAIGMRVKLAARGSGRWKSSGGYRSKFGLLIGEILHALEHLESLGMQDCFQLLHFHLGSQITNIRMLNAAVNEAARLYAELVKRGAGLNYLDVGGGLGVDYDGSRTDFESSINYSLQEYANDIVYYIAAVCRDADVPEPEIITESGRAISAFHAALIFETLGVSEQGGGSAQPSTLPLTVPEDYEQPLQTLAEIHQGLTVRNAVEYFHDAQQAIETANNLFVAGFLPLEQRVLAEEFYFEACHRIRSLCSEMDFVPEELRSLDQMLSDTYFCNFSLFQSMPDSWAISQLFPIMPIHRLNERPRRQAVLADITCDSDGKVDSFINRRDVRKTLALHETNGEPYYLGAFLVGAYQEILGDLHNLFGDTNMVHVDVLGDGRVTLGAIHKGDNVRDVLSYVAYNCTDLVRRLQHDVEEAVTAGRLNDEQAGELMRFYESGLDGYTYLEKSEE